MIFDILKKFSSIIAGYKVIDYDFFGSNYKVIIDIYFTDSTTLHIKDYLFSDGKRKYSYHW